MGMGGRWGGGVSIAVNRATAVGVVRVRGGFIVSPYGAQREQVAKAGEMSPAWPLI